MPFLNSRFPIRLFSCFAISVGVLTGFLLSLGALHAEAVVQPASHSDKRDYFEVVKAYADALLTHGRDTYGAQESPLFEVALDRHTFKSGDFESIEGIRKQDRIFNGANPMHDENLYQVLYALTVLTGNPQYEQDADQTLKFFFENCQSPQTGLMAWGEHLGWDFEHETLSSRDPREYHEFFRSWVLWERSYALAPEACLRFARGLWDNQIHDQETGDFSRHARWSRRETSAGNGYPRHAGFYIETWARAYQQKNDPVLAHAVETLIGLYSRSTSAVTGAFPYCTRAEQAKVMFPPSDLSLAVSLTHSAPMFPPALRDQMQQMAGQIDQVFLATKHDLTPGGRGFVTRGNIDTLEAFTKGTAHTKLFATGYGKATDAQFANLCNLRWQQLTDPERKKGYERLILAAADRYLTAKPDLKGTLFPGAFGDVIYLLLNAQELSGKPEYLARAHFFARMALPIFLPDDSPLPLASSQNVHYEAITRADTLMMALLRLWQIENKPEAKISLVYTDR